MIKISFFVLDDPKKSIYFNFRDPKSRKNFSETLLFRSIRLLRHVSLVLNFHRTFYGTYINLYNDVSIQRRVSTSKKSGCVNEKMMVSRGWLGCHKSVTIISSFGDSFYFEDFHYYQIDFWLVGGEISVRFFYWSQTMTQNLENEKSGKCMIVEYWLLTYRF